MIHIQPTTVEKASGGGGGGCAEKKIKNICFKMFK